MSVDTMLFLIVETGYLHTVNDRCFYEFYFYSELNHNNKPNSIIYLKNCTLNG